MAKQTVPPRATRSNSPYSPNVVELRGKIAAINKSQAVIELELDGTVITANDNFLNALEYRLEEIQGRHHGIFVDPVYRASDEYRRFWEKLGRGEYDSGQYKRLGKSGKEVDPSQLQPNPRRARQAVQDRLRALRQHTSTPARH